MADVLLHSIDKTKGSNQSDMRERNERLVLTLLRRLGPLPKVEIARKTGLTAQTVSVIMRELEAEGLLIRGNKLRGKIGQPSIPMGLAPQGAYFFGLKVGRRSSELILVDFLGAIVERRRISYEFPAPQEVLNFVQAAVASICAEIAPEAVSRVAGLGIACPYFMWEWGAVIGVSADKMSAWRTFDLKKEITEVIDFPVYFGNDATCACGAELVFGQLQKPSDFLYIYIGTFIGGGVVLNGQLYTGSRANAGAIGPFPLSGVAGSDSQIVDVASLVGLEKRLLAAGLDADILWNAPDTLDINIQEVSDWLNDVIPALTLMILSAVSIIDFSSIVIDGAIPSELREKMVEQLRENLSQSNLSGLIPPEIHKGSLGSDARALGAASLPISNQFMLES